MSDLAYNLAGEPFEVPNMAGGWRVRKLKPKGAPEVVYGREGIPLVLPIDADMDALRHEARTEGRYRLDPVDEQNRMIPNATAAYVCIHASESPAAPPPTARPVSPSTDHAVIEAMRLNSELARSIVDKFPLMLESAAALVRAADGAGMPAREPRAWPEPREREKDAEEEEEEDDDEDEEDAEEEDEDEADEPPPKAKASNWAGLLETLIRLVAPAIMNALTSGKLQLPGGLGALLDCRRASAKTCAAGAHTASTPSVVSAPDQRGPAPARHSASPVRVVPHDTTPMNREVVSMRVAGPFDVAQAAGGVARMRASGPRVVAQAADEVARMRASGPRVATQAADEVARMRVSGPRVATQAADEVARMRVAGPRVATQAADEVDFSRTSSPRVVSPRVVVQPADEAAPTRASVPYVAMQAAGEAAGPHDATRAAGDTVSLRTAGPRDTTQAAGEAGSLHAISPHGATQAADDAAAMRAAGPHDATQAAGDAIPLRTSGPHDATQAAGEAAPLRAAGPRDATQDLDNTAPTHAFVPPVTTPVASEAAEATEAEFEEDPELELEPEPSTEDTVELPTLDPAALAHFVAIQGALTFREGMLARALAAELTPSEMRAWLAELRRLSVPEAVARIREVLGADDSDNTSGGAS